MSAMKLEIMSRKTIKPSSPTPQHLKTFKLSLWDKSVPPVHGATIFFYHLDTNQNDDKVSRFYQKSHCLQKTLSDTLLLYYPLAGQLVDDSTVDCNDQGAYFMEAQIHCQLLDVLDKPDPDLLKHFNPTTDPEFAKDCNLAVQVTLFDCGGMAISVCASHKLMDGTSMFTFFQSWTAMTSENGNLVAPKFVEPSFSPPEELVLNVPRVQQSPPGNFATRRFVFPASKIASLKANILGAIGQHQYLTNMDVVLALIMKCAIAASKSLSKSSESSLFFHNVNLRRRMDPPLPENSLGNIYWTVPVVFKAEEVELNQLACKMRKGLTEFYNDKASKVRDQGEVFNDLTGKNYYGCTSLCKLPLYETDFGWGKPLWVVNLINAKNLIVLMDTKQGNDIEAWVSLDVEEMAKFEVDDELLAFAAFNPSAFINN